MVEAKLNKNIPFQENQKINHILTDDNQNLLNKKNSTKYSSQDTEKIKVELSPPNKKRHSFSNANDNNKILTTSDFAIGKKNKNNYSSKKIIEKKNQEKIIKILKKTEKSKIPHIHKKGITIPIKPVKLETPSLNKNNRVAKNGITINKINKKNYHISFADEVTDNSLIEIIPVQSFKMYNSIQYIPKDEFFDDKKKCCFIF